MTGLLLTFATKAGDAVYVAFEIALQSSALSVSLVVGCRVGFSVPFLDTNVSCTLVLEVVLEEQQCVS